MKNLVIKLIEVYQEVLSIILKNLLGTQHFCRFRPTCSQYIKNVIKEKGVLKGSFLGVLRILKCQPFFKVAYE